ncbi:MAG: outer membrane beta-barrel protein, partial [Pseudomonadales bacterium]
MNTKAALVFLLAVLFISPANAQNGYAGASLSFVNYSEDGISDDASLSVIFGRVGVFFNENLSGEIRAGFGVGDDSVTAFSIT